MGSLAFDDPALPSAYSGAGVFVLPSHSESGPLVALEALAANTLVVLTKYNSLNLEELREYVKDVDPTDLKEIKKSVMDFLNTPLNTGDLKTIIRNYTWEPVAKQLASIYENVLNRY